MSPVCDSALSLLQCCEHNWSGGRNGQLGPDLHKYLRKNLSLTYVFPKFVLYYKVKKIFVDFYIKSILCFA